MNLRRFFETITDVLLIWHMYWCITFTHVKKSQKNKTDILVWWLDSWRRMHVDINIDAFRIFHDMRLSGTYVVRAVSIVWRTTEPSQNRIHLTQFRIFIEVELETVCGPTAFPAAVVFRPGRSNVERASVADTHSLTGWCGFQRICEWFSPKIGGTRRNNTQQGSQKHPAIQTQMQLFWSGIRIALLFHFNWSEKPKFLSNRINRITVFQVVTDDVSQWGIRHVFLISTGRRRIIRKTACEMTQWQVSNISSPRWNSELVPQWGIVCGIKTCVATNIIYYYTSVSTSDNIVFIVL